MPAATNRGKRPERVGLGGRTATTTEHLEVLLPTVTTTIGTVTRRVGRSGTHLRTGTVPTVAVVFATTIRGKAVGAHTGCRVKSYAARILASDATGIWEAR